MAKYLASLLLVIVVVAANGQEKKLAQPDLKGDLMLDLGMNFLLGDNDSTEAWPSRSIGLYYTQRVKISNKFSFYPGIGLGTERHSFKTHYHLTADNGNIVMDSTVALIKRNKLIMTYVDVPLEIRFHPKGTQEGEGFFVGAGVIGGFRLGAHTKLKYVKDGKKGAEKVQSNFGLNDLRYGIQLRVGWKGAHLFIKKYYSTTYRNDRTIVDRNFDPVTAGQTSYNPTTTTIGINFTGF